MDKRRPAPHKGHPAGKEKKWDRDRENGKPERETRPGGDSGKWQKDDSRQGSGKKKWHDGPRPGNDERRPQHNGRADGRPAGKYDGPPRREGKPDKDRSFGRREGKSERSDKWHDQKPGAERRMAEKPFAKRPGAPAPDKKKRDMPFREKPESGFKPRRAAREPMPEPEVEEKMPLNKFIAHCGECSRRDAAELVKQGKVKVNGELVLDPGHKIERGDQVTLSGKKLSTKKGHVYLLLNKPKGFITTTDDPQGRKTVMELVANSGAERLFPVGRLDRNTSGLLLITNDGALTQRLSHPSFEIKKVYHVTLDKPLTSADFEKISAGVTLEDGVAKVDALAYLDKKNELGLEIHSGKNRIVRRIFESLGYVVDKLDRVMYAGLTKKNLPRGKWRFLDPKEVIWLKHFKS